MIRLVTAVLVLSFHLGAHSRHVSRGSPIMITPRGIEFQKAFGSPLEFTCTMRDNDHALISGSWFDNNGEEVTATSGRVFIENVGPNTKKLHITSFSESDVGFFRCEAQFPQGVSYRSYFLLESNICESGKFQCANGRCKSQSLVCDGVKDCEDGSDEHNCSRIVRTCRTQLKECYDIPNDYMEHIINISRSWKDFFDNVKRTPLRNHCRRAEEFFQCLINAEEECGSSPYWHDPRVDVQNVIYNYVCREHIREINENLDCILSGRSMIDYYDCRSSQSNNDSPLCIPGKFEKDAHYVSACMEQSFTVRINNGTNGCRSEASDLTVNLINEVAAMPDPCPYYTEKQKVERRENRKLQHGVWNKKILDHFNLIF